MRFGVLGRLEVFRADGVPVSIPGPARRQVLAALLARAGTLVGAATLIEDVWGPAPPRSAIGNLRSHVARLRENLGPDRDVLSTEGDGYRLHVEPGDIDAARFEALADRAAGERDSAGAIALYDEALALWRDEAYLEFGDAPFAVGERVRLAELRDRARERRTELALDLGQAGDLIGELEQRVRAAPYRERGWEQLALALYRDNRQADAIQACRRARYVLVEDLGVDPGPGLQEIEVRILRQDPALLAVTTPHPSAREALQGRCPYLGLTGYDEKDAPIFVGRERLTSVVAVQLADHSVVVLTGASGVGKSSLVRAGLIPALRAGAIPGSSAWRISARTPTQVGRIADEGRRPELLILDQAEELFTALDAGAADALVADVANYVSYGGGRLLLVLRSDYYGRVGELRRLAALAEKATVLVGPMRADELRRALVEPAAAAGVRLEPELVETIMDDVAGQAEPLPLLSEAMVRTWHDRDGDLLTLDGYQRSGGLAGALEAAAEECYQRLDEDARTAARYLLVRMAAPADGGGWARQPLATGELPAAGPDRAALDGLARSRLVVITEQRAELAHDALLGHWPRLRDWLDERAASAGLVDHLGRAAASWRASGHSPDDLYRGPRLAAALDWRAAHPEDLSAEERDYLDSSARAAQAELTAAREQGARAARGRRRLRRVAVALGVVVVLAVAGGVVALHERGTARRRALAADVSKLATLAANQPTGQNDVALLLGAQGYELQPSATAAGGLQTALMQTPPGLDRVITYPSPSTMPHLDRTGRLLAVPGADGSVTVYDVATGRPIHTFAWSTARQFASFSADDRYVAAGGADGAVAVWDLSTGRLSGAPVPVGDGVVHPVFDPNDDNRLYVVSTHGGVSAWDRGDPANPRLVSRFPGLYATQNPNVAPNITVSGDGRYLAAGETYSSGGDSRVWDTGTDRAVSAFKGPSLGNFVPGSDLLPFGFGDDTIIVDASAGREVANVPGTGGAALAILGDGARRLVVPQVVGGDDTVAVYDVSSRQEVGTALRVGGTGSVPLGFRANGQLVTSDADRASVWTLGRDLPPLGVRLDTARETAGFPGGASSFAQFLPSTRNVLVTVQGAPSNVYGAALYDLTTGRFAGPLLDGDLTGPVDGSRDGRFLVADTTGGLGIWDATTGKQVASLPGVPALLRSAVSTVHWSDDGKLIAAVVGGGAPYVWTVSDPTHPSSPRRFAIGPGIVDDVQFTPDSRRLIVVWASNSMMSAIDLSTGRVVWQHGISGGFLRQSTISPDGTTVALDVGTPSAGTVTLLDAATGAPKRSLSMPSWGGIGYIDGGRWLVIGSNQPAPQVQLHDAMTLQAFGAPFPIGDVDEHPLPVDQAGTRFSESLEYDITPPLYTTPVMWNVDPSLWIRTACAIAGRNLTRAEWRQYLPDRPYRVTCPGLPAGS